MKTNAKQVKLTEAAQQGAGFTELNIEESRRITGGSDPAPTGVWAGEDGRGCIPPFFPPFQIPYPPFRG